MRVVVVTGIAGRIGGRIGAALRLAGLRVVGVDKVPAPENPPCDAYFRCDLSAAAEAGPDYDSLEEAMA